VPGFCECVNELTASVIDVESLQRLNQSQGSASWAVAVAAVFDISVSNSLVPFLLQVHLFLGCAGTATSISFLHQARVTHDRTWSDTRSRKTDASESTLPTFNVLGLNTDLYGQTPALNRLNNGRVGCKPAGPICWIFSA
jgi:hypothetical protein